MVFRVSGSAILFQHLSLLLILFVVLLCIPGFPAESSRSKQPEVLFDQPIQATISFEENRGQWPHSVLYKSVAKGYDAFLTRDGLRLSPTDPVVNHQEIEFRWVGANTNPEISAQGLLPYHSNYFIGGAPEDWTTSVPFYSTLTYRNLYPGISVVYHANGNEIEHDIHLEPGADPASLRLAIQGAKNIALSENGALILKSQTGSFTLETPKIYQLTENGSRIQIAGNYVLKGTEVFLSLGEYDHKSKLIVDPVLSYSTYLPVLNALSGAVLSVDSSGAACVTDGKALYGYDPNGNVTFTVSDTIGVPPQIGGTAVFRDGQGNCYLAGTVGPSVTPTGTTFGSAQDGIAKFSSTGTLVYVAYFGGRFAAGGLPLFATPHAITADSLGNVYVAGTTNAADFPVKQAIQNLFSGTSFDAFVLALDSTGSSLLYSTFFGSETDALSIAVDSGQSIYITGGGSTIPTTTGAFQTSPNSSHPAFVAKISSSSALVYGTYLGGSGGETGNAIAVDGNGNAYVAGGTSSSDFPTKNPFQATPGPGFLSKLSADGSALVYSTFFGGGGTFGGGEIDAMAVDGNGAAYVAGQVGIGGGVPLVNPIQTDFLADVVLEVGALTQVFVAAFDNTGSALQYSTLFGGFDSNLLTTIGVDFAHNVYIAGGILNVGRDGFPILHASNGTLLPFFSCTPHACPLDAEGFIAKISPNSGTALASPATVDFGAQLATNPAAVKILIANVGSTDLQINNTAITGDYSISNNTCTGTLLSAKHCEVNVVFTPAARGTRTGVLTLSSNAPDSPRNIQLTGIGAEPIVSLNPTSLSLTSPGIGTAGPAKTVVLSNTGSDLLSFTSLTIVGTNAADFTENDNCSSPLGPGTSCNVNLTYKASTANAESASLQFVDNASNSPQTVPLTGTISAFALTIAPGSPSIATISAGQMAAYNLMIGGPGFSGNVTLSCTGAPAAASCSVPGSETLSSTPTAFQATVMTTARSTAIRLLPRTNLPPTPVVGVVLFGILAFVLLVGRHKRTLIAVAFVSLGVILIASCGGGGGPTGGSNGTPAGTYTVIVTATNGSSSQSVNLTLNVN